MEQDNSVEKGIAEYLTELRHGGVIIDFEPINVSLHVPDGQLELSYRVFLKGRSSVSITLSSGEKDEWEKMTLSTGEKFDHFDCRINIFAETNELKNHFVEDCRTLRQKLRGTSEGGREPIGSMSYTPALESERSPPRCIVNVLVAKLRSMDYLRLHGLDTFRAKSR